MKKRFLLGIVSLNCIFLLTSCGGILSASSEDNTLYPNEQQSTVDTEGIKSSKQLKYEPVYNETTVTYTTTAKTSKETSIEDTVSMVYDSVVSIEASSSSALSSGSGVLFGYDASLQMSYLVTCFHVIEDASIFEIYLSDGQSYAAQLVGGYSDLDLAILSFKTPTDKSLTYASIFEDSDTLKLGSAVACIGNPLGTLPGSVSSGVVSYVNRKINTNSYTVRTLIQTDVAINSGNSGGGLFNTAGALIGIVNAKYSSTGIEGLGFAIPSNEVLSTIESILETCRWDSANEVWSEGYVVGDYEYGFTISLGYVTSGYGWKASRTTVQYVSELSDDSTYTGVGYLKLQDIVTGISIDYLDESKTDYELTLTSQTDVMALLYADTELTVGDSIIFKVTRNNEVITVTVPVTQFIYSI